MNRGLFELAPGVCLDARHCVWLEEARTLLVADLHLGYAWAHRAAGNLMPIRKHNETVEQLQQLVAKFAPRQLIILGDIMHGSTAAEPVISELRKLGELATDTRLRLIAGNHDRHLPALLKCAGVNLELEQEIQLGPHLLLHGHNGNETAALARLHHAHESGGFVMMGHEHPAISISDRVATHLRRPCFLEGPGALILPAFSSWSAGTDIVKGEALGPYARRAQFQRAIAILAGKLLPMPVR